VLYIEGSAPKFQKKKVMGQSKRLLHKGKKKEKKGVSDPL
jgi:hypothetical protein